jgi:hypothetical protein
VDLIKASPRNSEISEQAILSITDDTRTFSQIAVLTDDKIGSLAAAIWHHWCQPYGNPETILSNQGKVWTSKLESRINSFTPPDSKIHCRSEKETFNPEVRQQWQQSQPDTSAEEFAQHWNFLCNLQGPANSKSGLDSLNEVDQNLEDVGDFVEDDPNIEDHRFEVPGQEIILRRKQVSLCRHKLQGRAYPKVKKFKTVWRPQEQLLEPEDPELDHEWLQLIQMERAIENHKNQLLETGVKGQWNSDEDRETFWENEENLAKRDDHLDDGDLEYINVILNSFSKQGCTHKNSNYPKLESFTPKEALARALAPLRTPPEFNLKFNQNSMTCGSEKDHLSYFSNVEEEGTSELGDYFSDNKEDDTWDEENLTSESNPWCHTDFNVSGVNFTPSQSTLSEWNPVISGLETINEARFEDDYKASKLNHISGLSEETKLAFSTWQPFIPPGPAFQNCAAPSQLLAFLSRASSLQEPTLTQISAISTSTKRTSSSMKPTSPRMVTSLLQPKDWPSLELTTRPFTPTWTKFQTESKKTSNNWQKDFPDHPEPSKQCRPWKRRSQGSNEHIRNQSTKLQNTPQVIDDGSKPQVCTPLKSQSSSIMKPKRSTTKIKYWETKWRKFSNRTPTCQAKSPKKTRPRQRNSKRIQLWLWSRKRSQPICSFNTVATVNLITKQRISPGENHSSKRRSESESHDESKFHDQQKRLNSKSESESKDKNYCQHNTQNFKSENKNKNVKVKAIKVRKEKALTKIKAKSTAKVNEVKAIEKTLTGFRIEGEKQLDQRIGSETTVTLLPRFTTMFNILNHISMVILNFMSVSKSVRSDLLDHHVHPFIIGNLSDCKTLCLSQQTASVQATKTLVKTLANSDSRRLFKVPETQPNLHDKNLSRNPFVPSHLPSGLIRNSETNLYHDSFIFNYLEFSR